MPAIPGAYEQRTRARGSLGVGPSGDAGGLFNKIGDAVGQYQEHGGQAAAARSMGEFRARWGEKYNALITSKDAGQPGFAQTVDDAFSEELDEQTRQLEGENNFLTRRFATNFLRTRATQMREQIRAHTQGIELQVAEAVDSQSFAAGLQGAALGVELDPGSFLKAEAEQKHLLESSRLGPVRRAQLQAQVTRSLARAHFYGIAKFDPKNVLDRLSAPNPRDYAFQSLSAEDVDKIRGAAQESLVDRAVMSTMHAYESVGVEVGNATVAQTEKLLPDDLVDDYRAHLNADRSNLRTQRREHYAEPLAQLERRIDAGTAGRAEERRIGEMYQQNALTPAEYSNLLERYDAAKRKRDEDGARIALARQAIQNGTPLDPADKDVRKDVDKLFEAEASQYAVPPGSDGWINAASQLAARTNILPESAITWARTAVASGNPELTTAAANALTRFREANPVAFAYVEDTKIKAFADQMDGMQRAGVMPKRADEIARANTYALDETRAKVLRESYRKDKLTETNADALRRQLNDDDAFDRSIWSSAPAASQDMLNDYERLTSEFYLFTNGDKSRARKLAYESLRGVYGISQVNGKPEILKYAPELVYPAIDVKVIRSDIDATIKATRFEPPAPQGLRQAGNIDLHARPTVKNADGTISTVRSMSFGDDKGEVLVPTIGDDGKVMSEQEAIAQYRKTGRHLGVFDSPEHATAYAEALHQAQGREYGKEAEKNIRLVPNALTAESRGLRWELHTVDEDGAEEVLLDSRNRPLIYEIPTDTARYTAARKAALEASKEAARVERAKRQENAARQRELEARLSEPDMVRALSRH